MRNLTSLAEEFVIRGGELLVIDEIHKYHPGTTDWSREIKEIYELFPNLKVIVSGSSLLQLKEGDADLSRRAVKYTMPGLSFREALRFYHGLTFPIWSLEDILVHPYDQLDYKYAFEIGGRSKDFKQIAGLKDSYIFADDWDMPDGAKLPLCML